MADDPSYGCYSFILLSYGRIKGRITTIPSCYHHWHCDTLPSRYILSLCYAFQFLFFSSYLLYCIQMDLKSSQKSRFSSTTEILVLFSWRVHCLLWYNYWYNRWERNWKPSYTLCYHFLYCLVGYYCEYDSIYDENEAMGHFYNR